MSPPGQTEQEYLCRWLSGKGWFRMARQKDLAKWDFMANRGKGTAEKQMNRDSRWRNVRQNIPGPPGDLLRERVEAVVAGLAAGLKGVRR